LRGRHRHGAGNELPDLRRAGADRARLAAAGGAGHRLRGRRARRLQRPSSVPLRSPKDLMTKSATHADVFVIGAGPAGLTAAYCLTRENPSVIVIEKDPVYVAGISRTVENNGFMFE